VHKRLNRSKFRLDCDLGMAQGIMNERGSRCSMTVGNSGKGSPIISAVSCAETADPIDLTFGLWTRVAEEAQVQSYSSGGANVPNGRAHWRHLD